MLPVEGKERARVDGRENASGLVAISTHRVYFPIFIAYSKSSISRIAIIDYLTREIIVAIGKE